MDTFKICNYFGMQYQYLGTFKTPSPEEFESRITLRVL